MRYELSYPSTIFPIWLTEWMEAHQITLWGAADLRGFSTPRDETGQKLPFALSWAIPINSQIMVSIRNGPNQAYADEYARVNNRINELSEALAAEIKDRGFRSKPLAASDRTDAVNIKGDFPHKTAATRAGLGWIGHNCQLITRPFGPWVRLGTVFTDIELLCESPIEINFCGNCTLCVEACPAKALKGNAWCPGLPREEILDVQACDQWKKKHYFQYHEGHNCGICSAICPYGLITLKKKPEIAKLFEFHMTTNGFIVEVADKNELKEFKRFEKEQKRAEEQRLKEKQVRRTEINRKIAIEKRKKREAGQLNLFDDPDKPEVI